MADLRRIHLTISKGMKLSCTVEHALEDVIVVSLKHKNKEYRGILLDSSQRHLPPGLCFHQDSDGGNSGDNSTNAPTQDVDIDVRGATLVRRYSYNNDPAKYNEQPLPMFPAINIRSSRNKTVRNIRLRPRQTLCAKCKSMIHDNKKPKSPHPNIKTENDAQEDVVYHNTRYRVATVSKTPPESDATSGPALRSGLRNRRHPLDNPKVLLENIRPKREVKSKRKTSPEISQKSKLTDSTSKKNMNALQGQFDDSNYSANKADVRTKSDWTTKQVEESMGVMFERSVGVDNNFSIGQNNRQPVVRLDKSMVQSVCEGNKPERAPTIQIINIPRPTPAIKISYGDGAVLKIPPRLPGAEMKSPDGHSTADESPAHSSPVPESPLTLKKIKKASRRSRDRLKHRNGGDDILPDNSDDCVKSSGHHRKHKRKHKHRHANIDDENFNSESCEPPPPKYPTIIAKFSLIPSNDVNGNETKKETDFGRGNMQSKVSVKIGDDSLAVIQPEMDTITKTAEKSTLNTVLHKDSVVKADEEPDGVIKIKMENDPFRLDDEPLIIPEGQFIYVKDPLRIESPPVSQDVSQDVDNSESQPRDNVMNENATEMKESSSVNEISPYRNDVRQFDIWGSPEVEGSPAKIEAPPFLTDDSSDGLEIKPLTLKNSPRHAEDKSHVARRSQERNDSSSSIDSDDNEKKNSLPYGVGMFEDLTPDEDEDNHDDTEVSQPAYQLPLSKNPRLLYAWNQNDNLSRVGSSSHVPSIAAYFPNSPAPVMSAASPALYPNSSHVFQNGPSSSLFSSTSAPAFPNSAVASFPNSPASIFPSSPAPRIQNSPTPIIQKSPVPIFQYSSSSRHQGSPVRRYLTSPSRRFHTTSDGSAVSGFQPVAEGGSVHRHSGQTSSTVQYQTQSEINVSAKYRNSGDVASGSRFSIQKESDVLPDSDKKCQTKVDGRSSLHRYQSTDENSTVLRFQLQSENTSTVRLPTTEDNNSAVHYQSTSDNSCLPKFLVQNDSNSSSSIFPSLVSNSSLPRYTLHSNEGSTSAQMLYQVPGSLASHYSLHNESLKVPKYQVTSSASVPPTQTNRTPATVAVFPNESERKSMTLTIKPFSGSGGNLSGAFSVSPSSPAQQAPTGSMSDFSSKSEPVHISLIAASNVETAKPSGHNVSLIHQGLDHRCTASTQQGQSAPVSVQGKSSLILSRVQSISASSHHGQFSGGNTTDSDDDSCVPGFAANSNSSSSIQIVGQHSLSDGDNARPLILKTQSIPKCINNEGKEIRVGDIVWGKIQGFPWWPGRVLSITVAQRDHDVTHLVHISWFGSSTMSHMQASDLHPFMEGFNARHNKKKRGPYRIAIQQAMLAAQASHVNTDASHDSILPEMGVV